MQQWWIIVVAILAGTAAAWGWRRLRASQRLERERQARLDFDHHRTELEPAFLAAAAASGKPRGLRWTRCQLQPGVLFARDSANGELFALVGATISFEAIEGGDMEEVEAVSNLRAATAVFVFRDDQWTTDGRAVFNLEPREAMERYSESLAPITDD